VNQVKISGRAMACRYASMLESLSLAHANAMRQVESCSHSEKLAGAPHGAVFDVAEYGASQNAQLRRVAVRMIDRLCERAYVELDRCRREGTRPITAIYVGQFLGSDPASGVPEMFDPRVVWDELARRYGGAEAATVAGFEKAAKVLSEEFGLKAGSLLEGPGYTDVFGLTVPVEVETLRGDQKRLKFDSMERVNRLLDALNTVVAWKQGEPPRDPFKLWCPDRVVVSLSGGVNYEIGRYKTFYGRFEFTLETRLVDVFLSGYAPTGEIEAA